MGVGAACCPCGWIPASCGNDDGGFGKVHGSLREIARIVPDTRPSGYAKIRSRRIFPEGEENMVAYRLPIFYRSRMTEYGGNE